jgi:hypothetical protein
VKIAGQNLSNPVRNRVPKRRLWTRRRDSEALSWKKLYKKEADNLQSGVVRTSGKC